MITYNIYVFGMRKKNNFYNMLSRVCQLLLLFEYIDGALNVEVDGLFFSHHHSILNLSVDIWDKLCAN